MKIIKEIAVLLSKGKKAPDLCMKFLGKHKHMSDSEFNPKELAMGIKVELEHTDDVNIAKEISKDHLAELPDYYTRLKKMEEEGKDQADYKEGE